MKRFFIMICLALGISSAKAQVDFNNLDSNQGFNQVDENGVITTADQRRMRNDSLGSNKEIPKGVFGWNVDPLFGDRTPAVVDTLSHMYQNTTFTSGLRGEYNVYTYMSVDECRKHDGNCMCTGKMFLVS